MKKNSLGIVQSDTPQKLKFDTHKHYQVIAGDNTKTSVLNKLPKEIASKEKGLEIFTSGDGETFRVHIKPKWSAIDG